MEEKIRNAQISHLQWNFERGLSHFIGVKIGNNNWSFGGLNLRGERCAKWIQSIANTFDLERLSDNQLVGSIVRIKTNRNDEILAIGHPLKEQWIILSEIFKDE